LVINKNRIFVGLILILSILIFYYFKLDLFFFSLITLGIFYEIYKSGLLTAKKLLVLIFFYLLSFLIYININISIYIFIFLILVAFFVTLFFSKYVKISFAFFLCILSIIIFSLFTQSRDTVYLIILLSFINDTFAFLFGNFLKGPLIVPNISPKKTWTGTTISSVISFSILIFYNFSYLAAIILSILLFLGDIYFSFIKRKLSIKDFSNILSGHGGILDRLDSMSFLFIAFALFNLI